MSVKQIMRWGHDFLRISGGMFNLWEKSMCQKKKPRNICWFSHSFTFPYSLMLWGERTFWSCILLSPMHFSFIVASPRNWFFLIFYPSFTHAFTFFFGFSWMVHAQSIIRWLSSNDCGWFLIIFYSILFMRAICSSYFAELCFVLSCSSVVS